MNEQQKEAKQNSSLVNDNHNNENIHLIKRMWFLFFFLCCLLFVVVDSVNLNINNIFAVFLFVCGYSWRHEKKKEFFCKNFNLENDM